MGHGIPEALPGSFSQATRTTLIRREGERHGVTEAGPAETKPAHSDADPTHV